MTRTAALIACLAWLLARPIEAHSLPGSNLQVIADLTEQELTLEITAETSLVPPLDDVRFEKGENFPSLEERRAALETYFRERCPVLIDGVAVAPSMRALDFRRMDGELNLGKTANFVVAYVVVVYPTKKKPRKIDLTWSIFLPDSARELYQPDPDAPALDPLTVDSVFYAYGKIDVIRFSPSEPQFIWHAEDAAIGEELAKRVAANVAPPPSRGGFSLAWVFVGVAAASGIVAFLARRRLPLWQAAALLAVVGVAVALRGSLTLRGGTRAGSLSADEAKQRFLDLHQNLYRAFDYRDDAAIYDTLAQSVSGDLLEKVYLEIKKSLILRDEGGAESRVRKVEYLSCEARPGDGKSFTFDCHWRVHGLVNHWGHTHERINEYRADYALSPSHGAWRITRVDIKQEQPVSPASAPRSGS